MRHTRLIAASVIASASLLGAACTTGGGGYHPPANTPPVAHAVATPATGQASLLVNFDGSTSTDAEGAVIDWAWDFDDAGATATGATAPHTYNTAGIYTVTLTVTDNGALTDTDTAVITVTAAPDDPNGRYVATTGADTGTCSASATPCLTVQYAADQATSGDTVYTAAGSYPEMVYVTKNLTFKGANAGISAGATPGTRGAESIVKGIRSGTAGVFPGTTAYTTNIDGMRIDPQGDAALISLSAIAFVSVFGGNVSVTNTVFYGGAFVSNCSYNCTTMSDYAFSVKSGTVAFNDNSVQNFRRPVNIGQSTAAATNATVTGNAVSGVTSRGFSIGGSTGQVMPGITMTGNTVDATGITSPSSPAGITISNGGNTLSGNTFTALSSGVFIDLCKKFNTNNNTVTGNTFVGAGVVIQVSQPGTSCTTSATEGQSQWIGGGGRINGLVVTDNNFTAGFAGVSHSIGGFGASVVPVSTGPIDSTCNYWGTADGPTNAGNPGGTGASLSFSGSPNPAFTFSPWRIASAPGGACTGS